MTRRFHLVVLDWDGTVADSTGHIIDCVRAAARDLSWEPPGRHAVRDIIGLGLIESCQVLFPDRELEDYDRLAEAYRQHFFSQSPEANRLFEGAHRVLRSLRADGYLLAVATGKSRRGLREALRETGLGALLHASRCADETASKPDPQMLLEIIEELGVDPARTLMVGDTEYDLAMASNAGVHAVGVSYGAHDRARLLSHNPLACLEDINDLPAILKNWQAAE